MKIDNSRAKLWHRCAWAYAERYVNDLERKVKHDGLAFGTRLHQLGEVRMNRLRGVDQPVPPCEAEFEAEAQAMQAAYEAQYPVEAFDVLAVEKYFEVPLPGSEHIYIGKFDGIVRAHDTGMLNIYERKTEKRGSKQNHPQAWSVRPQVGLYIWAAEQIYKEPFDQIILDVMTRQSPAGEKPCFFSRQNLQRTDSQKEDAVRNITWVADQIEKMTAEYGTGKWPFDGEMCHNGMWKCDYHDLHIFGRDQFTLERDFQQAEEYLAL